MTRTVFAGWSGLPEARDPRPALASMLAVAGGDPSALQVASGDGWAVGWCAALPAVEVLRPEGGGVLLSIGAPRLRERAQGSGASDLLRALGETSTSGSELAGSFLLLALGVSGLPPMRAAVDRFAVQPFYHAPLDGGCVFASSPLIVARHPGIRAALSPQAIYDFLYSSVVFSPDTVFDSVTSLPAGHFLDVEPAKTSTHVYWRASFGRAAPAAPAPDAAELKARLREAVAAHVGDGEQLGCFLSGGIDSSTVTGMVREVTGEAPRTFSIGFDSAGYDELEYARIVSRRFSTRHHEYYVTPDDIVDLFPAVIAGYGQPFGNSSVIPTLCCARLAREHGVTRMLAGDGGDELFGGNERYVQQLVLGLYAHLPGWLRRGVVEPALSAAAPLQRVALLRKASSYVQQANVPLPDRLETYNYLRLIGTDRVLSGDFLAQVDAEHPRNMKRAIFAAVTADSDTDRLLGLDLKITLADNDLPKVIEMCAQAGVDVRFPFLDEGLLDISSRLAPRGKATLTRLRGFFKDSMRDFLPAEVIAKRKHGFGLPFGVWATQHPRLRDFAHSLLEASRTRGIVSPSFIDELRATLLPAEPRYYGPLVWDLMVLEAWLQAHGG